MKVEKLDTSFGVFDGRKLLAMRDSKKEAHAEARRREQNAKRKNPVANQTHVR